MAKLQRFIRKNDLHQFVGLKRQAVADLIKRGEFPASIKLSDTGYAVAWTEDDLIAWQQKRIATRK
jgi:predicted DNA-binding transcriptional regulator AlpA